MVIGNVRNAEEHALDGDMPCGERNASGGNGLSGLSGRGGQSGAESDIRFARSELGQGVRLAYYVYSVHLAYYVYSVHLVHYPVATIRRLAVG